jgi:hypothetical protein
VVRDGKLGAIVKLRGLPKVGKMALEGLWSVRTPTLKEGEFEN